MSSTGTEIPSKQKPLRAAIFVCSLILDEPDLSFLGRIGGHHELADGLEDLFEAGIGLGLQRFQSFRQVLMRGQQHPQPNEGAHDLDVDRDGLGATQDPSASHHLPP